MSKFAETKGILFAADLEDEHKLYSCLDEISDYIQAIKVGNALLYHTGATLIRNIKQRFDLPVIADIKLTDVPHIAARVAEHFAENGADAITISGICGKPVFDKAMEVLSEDCELWIFSEFTHPEGLIDSELADESIQLAVQAGAKGIQVPATIPGRIQKMRTTIGKNVTIVSCGIGVQGGTTGSAIAAGANMEIIGRSIYGKPDPKTAAKIAKEAIEKS